MLHRLCEPPSIHLSFSLATVLPRRYTYRFYYDRYNVKIAPVQCTSFTAWTTRVSNPVCSPRFRASASGQAQPDGFPIGIPVDIYAFHRSTYCSSGPYLPQDSQFALQFHG